MHKVKKQSGFTLVEIAIVLVIIGLLLAGVLKGQELIESSRIKSMAKDLSSFSAMMTSLASQMALTIPSGVQGYKDSKVVLLPFGPARSSLLEESLTTRRRCRVPSAVSGLRTMPRMGAAAVPPPIANGVSALSLILL